MYRVDFICPTTGKVVTSNPIVTNLGEIELIKLAKDALIEDRLSTAEELKDIKPRIRLA
jgi:hypothetical protein